MKLLSNRYQIVSSLGSGGFGQTFLAKDTQLPSHPNCVVKKLQPQQTDEKTMKVAQRLFETEAKVLQKIGKKHEQIPELLAYFVENQQFYLIQEYIEGDLLSDIIGNGQQWPERAVFELLSDLLSVLSFLQDDGVIHPDINGVIHRDIKPSNLIKRHQTNKIVLIDFGAVKEVIYPQTQGSDTIGIHTPGYAPHEQFIGKPRYSSDVYAVGMVAIEALTGNSPLSLIQEAPDHVEWGEYLSGVLEHYTSKELIGILGKMTHPDYKQRYSLAKEVLSDINGLNHSQNQGSLTTIQSIPTTKLQTDNNVTVKTPNRSKLVIFSVLLLLFGGIGGFGVFYVVENLNAQPENKPGLFNNF